MRKMFLILFFVVFALAHNTPYSLKKFRLILENSKLQAPLSAYNPLYSRHYGDFKYYFNKYFYLLDGRYMTFYMCGKKHRSELRFKENWKVDTKFSKILDVKVKLFCLGEIKEFTFLQIHADSTLKNQLTINKPLLRIVWLKKLYGVYNHLWAVIRTTSDKYNQKYQKIDLNQMPEDFFNIKIEVKSSKLNIWVNNLHKIDNFDISYWNKYQNYFKLGVYLQDNGCAKVLFDEIKMQ